MPCIYPKIYILLKSTKYFMMKAFKFRLYPTINQSNQLNQHIGICRFVYNWALNQRVKTYEQIGKSISRFDLNKLIPNLKKQTPWLGKINSQSLKGMAKQVESAFTRFFREKNDFPKFKSKKNTIQSFSIPQYYKVDFENNTIKLPKIGEIKTVIKKHLIVDDGKELPVKQIFSESTTIDVDIGINFFSVMSIGEEVENPNYLKNSLKRRKVLQKRVSRKQKGSKNREKAKQKLAVLHEKITNQRNDFQHKLSFKLVSENQAIVVETLNVKGMIKKHHLAQAIDDSA